MWAHFGNPDAGITPLQQTPAASFPVSSAQQIYADSRICRAAIVVKPFALQRPDNPGFRSCESDEMGVPRRSHLQRHGLLLPLL
jgi:hypothetical protein